jgi:hypothetical protein
MGTCLYSSIMYALCSSIRIAERHGHHQQLGFDFPLFFGLSLCPVSLSLFGSEPTGFSQYGFVRHSPCHFGIMILLQLQLLLVIHDLVFLIECSLEFPSIDCIIINLHQLSFVQIVFCTHFPKSG